MGLTNCSMVFQMTGIFVIMLEGDKVDQNSQLYSHKTPSTWHTFTMCFKKTYTNEPITLTKMLIHDIMKF